MKTIKQVALLNAGSNPLKTDKGRSGRSTVSLMRGLYLVAMLSVAGFMPAAVYADVTVLGTSRAALRDSGTITVTAPDTIVDGDVMILFLGASNTPPLTVLDGWKKIVTGGPNDVNLTSLYRVYKSGGQKSFSINTLHTSFACLISLRGADQSKPIVDSGFIKDQGGRKAPKGESSAPSVSSVSDGLLLCGFMWDDPYQGINVSGMDVLASDAKGGDGLTVACMRTTGAATGIRTAVAPAIVRGGGNEIGMAVSVRPAVSSTTPPPVANAQE